MELVIDGQDYSRYPVYKDSRLDWLGEIPKEWELIRFKYLYREINERSIDGSGEVVGLSWTRLRAS